MRKKDKRLQKGFTLIELIIVIAILGVLAALIVPNVTGRVKSAKEGVDKANAKVIEDAINQYIAESGDETGSALGDLTKPEQVVATLQGQVEYPAGSGKEYGPYLSSTASGTPQTQGKIFTITIDKGEAKVEVTDSGPGSE